jgi:hypothetical protein
MTKTPKEIRDEVARNHGFESWDELAVMYSKISGRMPTLILDELITCAQEYNKEVLEKAQMYDDLCK